MKFFLSYSDREGRWYEAELESQNKEDARIEAHIFSRPYFVDPCVIARTDDGEEEVIKI